MELVRKRARIVLVGEGMLELSQGGDGTARLGYGGDTLNTAIHLARLGHHVRFLTALGADPFSDDLRAAWARENIDTSLVLTDPLRQPGLYAIRTDSAGERSFHYWRDDSAARQMLSLPDADAALAAAADADIVVFSLITLAVLPPDARRRLLAFCRQAQAQGALVAFDGNYRPRLWRDPTEARQARDEAIGICTLGLPTLADEQMLSGEDDARAVTTHWASLGAREVVVKLGADGAQVGPQTVTPPRRIRPVDTSGAGDAFNAGYLSARYRGGSPVDAALAGHRLAGWVVERPGAIPARDHDAPYR